MAALHSSWPLIINREACHRRENLLSVATCNETTFRHGTKLKKLLINRINSQIWREPFDVLPSKLEGRNLELRVRGGGKEAIPPTHVARSGTFQRTKLGKIRCAPALEWWKMFRLCIAAVSHFNRCTSAAKDTTFVELHCGKTVSTFISVLPSSFGCTSGQSAASV
jgi:hypothetical protein